MDVNDIGKAANGQHIYRHMAPHVHALVHLLLGIGPDVQACQEQKDECQGQSGHRARLQDRGWCPSTISLHKDTPILGIALAKDQLISDNIKLRLPRCHGTASRTQQYACRRLAAGQTAPCYAPECEQEADQHLRSGPHCQKAAYVRQPRRRRSLPDSSGCQAKACTVLCPGTAGCWLLSAGGQVHLRGALSQAVGLSLTGRQAHLPPSPALSPLNPPGRYYSNSLTCNVRLLNAMPANVNPPVASHGFCISAWQPFRGSEMDLAAHHLLPPAHEWISVSIRSQAGWLHVVCLSNCLVSYPLGCQTAHLLICGTRARRAQFKLTLVGPQAWESLVFLTRSIRS